MGATAQPIGYWLKQLDRLIEATFDRSLAAERPSRRHWQAMNALAHAPLDEQGLTDALRPFWGGDAVTLDEVVGELAGRGWIARAGDGRYALTPRGEAAHAAVAARVRATRRLMTDSLTEEEYHATVRVLRRMAENLEGALRGDPPEPPGPNHRPPAPRA